MAPPKHPSSLLDNPPAASSSEELEEQVASSEEAVSESESESESEASKPEPEASEELIATPQPAAKTQSSSSGETDSESDSETESESEPETDPENIEPVASKPVEVVPTVKSGTKRAPGESELELNNNKEAKKAKKKNGDDQEEEDGVGEEASKKSKLFQKIWSDEDEITLLEGMHEYVSTQAAMADMAAFPDLIKKSLKLDVSKAQIKDKIWRLKKKFEKNVDKKQEPTKPHDLKIFKLSKKLWQHELAGKAEQQPEANGKPKPVSNHKGSSTLAADKSEVIVFDKGFQSLGLSEAMMQLGIQFIGESKYADLKEQWSNFHIAQLELFIRRTELMTYQAKMILEALKSDR